jgi:hypothetical protein
MTTIDLNTLSVVVGGQQQQGTPLTCDDIRNVSNPSFDVGIIKDAVWGTSRRNMRQDSIRQAQREIRSGKSLKQVCNDAVDRVD